jgi:hypothetical protein
MHPFFATSSDTDCTTLFTSYFPTKQGTLYWTNYSAIVQSVYAAVDKSHASTDCITIDFAFQLSLVATEFAACHSSLQHANWTAQQRTVAQSIVTTIAKPILPAIKYSQ